MITRNCDWCNTEYTARSTRGKTCSRKCSDNLYNSSKRDNSKRKYYRTCITCTKDFTTASGGRERCLECSDKIKSDRELIKDVKSDIKDTKNAFNNLSNTLDECLKLLDSLRECTVCGRDYCKDVQGSNKYCSELCKNKQTKENSKKFRIDKEKRWRVNGKAQSGITIKALIERYGYTCYLCGEDVDLNDVYVNKDGYKVYGNRFPSRDHVIPIAKGGLHNWDNIKLAHRVCNSKKCDKIL